MLEILPIKLLSDDDSLIFGGLNVELGKLSRLSIPVANGFVVTPPSFKLKTVLTNFLLGDKELIDQSLILVKKELEKQAVPEELISETRKNSLFFHEGMVFSDIRLLWHNLINVWLGEIKQKIWISGFSPELAKNLTPQVISPIKKVSAFGEVYYDEIIDEVVLNIKQGVLTLAQHKQLSDIVLLANKKILIHRVYQWILDNELKIVEISLYSPDEEKVIIKKSPREIVAVATAEKRKTGVTKVILDLSKGFVIEKDVDGAFVASEKIINLNHKDDSFEELNFKLTETAVSLPEKDILFKLPDIPETAGGVRGTLRLLHQASLLKPLVRTLKFLKEEKKFKNIQLVIPFLRHSSELRKFQDKLSEEGINRNHNLQFWVEFTVGENFLNIDDYLSVGFDGVVLNLDELIGSLYGFDHAQENFAYLKKELNGLTKFLGGNIRKLKRLKIPVIAYGSLVYDISLLEFLVHEGINGIIVERYEAISMSDLLYKIEKKMVLKRIKN